MRSPKHNHLYQGVTRHFIPPIVDLLGHNDVDVYDG